MIVDHKLKAGDKISEVQVAAMLNVSRTPARLALKTLEVEGLIKKRSGRGFTVQAVQMEDIADGVEVRGVLEGLGARVMAKRRVDQAVKLSGSRLKSAIRQFRRWTTERNPGRDAEYGS